MKNYVSFLLRHSHAHVIGSYLVYNEKEERIGYSEGYIVKRRSVLCEFFKSSIKYEVYKRRWRYYFIMSGTEVSAMIKHHLFGSGFDLNFDNKLYRFKALDHSIKEIFLEGKHIGILKEIGVNYQMELALENTEDIELVLTAILNFYYIKSQYLKPQAPQV